MCRRPYRGESFHLRDAAVQVVRTQVRVPHGHLHVTVPQDLFQVIEVPAPNHEVAGERVPKIVKPEIWDVGPRHRVLEGGPDFAVQSSGRD